MKPYVKLRAEKIEFSDNILTIPGVQSGCTLSEVQLEAEWNDIIGWYCKSDPELKQLEVIGLRPI